MLPGWQIAAIDRGQVETIVHMTVPSRRLTPAGLLAVRQCNDIRRQDELNPFWVLLGPSRCWPVALPRESMGDGQDQGPPKLSGPARRRKA